MTDQLPLIGSRELAEKLGGISKMTVARWRACGFLPRPDYLSPDGHTVLWRRSTIDAWLRARQPADPELYRSMMAVCGGARTREWWDLRMPTPECEDAQHPALLDRLEILLAESPLIGEPGEGEEVETFATYPDRLKAAAAVLLQELRTARGN